ncbi:hypothetical protein BCR32DRAFT_25229 [Anaeromyces robustus]|uniref:F-box domain-containing protein n=1 Tax=Anaeromyces robustus TaxID=1754192 RepID=A0A1Y1X3F8_9FUNG|nr:hypothetical protein BCR32DRAFT_25229 [Anaeromyces robustus]|eukprot:ORX80168.1 hypothetical protein BCR32DRAFT_25229 [Anaeromyces robustus]
METIDLDDEDFFEDIDLDAENPTNNKVDDENEQNNRWQILHEKLVHEEIEENKINNLRKFDDSSEDNINIQEDKDDNKQTLKKMGTESMLNFTSFIEKIEDSRIAKLNEAQNKGDENKSYLNVDFSKSKYSFTSLPGRIQLEILSYCSESDLFNCLQTNFQISRAAAIILWGSQLHFGANDKERLKLFVGALNRKPQIHPYASYVQTVTIENIIDEIPMYTRHPCWILVRELLYHCSKNIRRLKLGFQDEKFIEIKSLEIPEIYFSCLEELDIEPYSDVSPEFITDLLKRCEANGRLKKLTIPNCFWSFTPFSVVSEIVRIGPSLALLDLSSYKQLPKQNLEELPKLTTEAQIKEYNDLMMMLANTCKNLQFLNLSHNMYIYDTVIEQFLINNTKLERINLEDAHLSDYTLLALSHAAPPTISFIELKCGYIDTPEADNVAIPPTTKFTTSLVEMALKELNNRKSLCDVIGLSLPDRLIQPGSTSLISTKVWLNQLEGCTLDEELNSTNDSGWRKWRKYGKLRILV